MRSRAVKAAVGFNSVKIPGRQRGVQVSWGDVVTCRVVVADDVDDYRSMVVQFLEREETIVVVAEACDGRQAVEMARREQPDVILLDLAMPAMDGLEALPLIHQASPETKVIVLSGFGAAEVRERATAGGAAAYVEKGTRPGQIVKLVREVCES